MKDEKNESGEELVDIDEKGNPIEKEKPEKKTKSNYKIMVAIVFCIIILCCCC